jgi:hypothetical protein
MQPVVTKRGGDNLAGALEQSGAWLGPSTPISREQGPAPPDKETEAQRFSKQPRVISQSPRKVGIGGKTADNPI